MMKSIMVQTGLNLILINMKIKHAQIGTFFFHFYFMSMYKRKPYFFYIILFVNKTLFTLIIHKNNTQDTLFET